MRSQYRVLFAFIILLVAISCLCTSTDVTPSTPPTNPPVIQPTQQQPPTQEFQPPSAEAPLPQNQQFFTEEFDSSLTSAWSILTVTGSDKANPDMVTVEPNNGKLVWDFESEYVYYYVFYEGFSYTDVTVDVSADNRGVNNNSISLICRYDPEVGWYEFNIANNGLYDILYAEVTSDGSIGYNSITNGGSNNIKQGKNVNEYSITCKGDKLSLTINGKSINTVTEKKYGLREGGVGVSVSAFDLLPVKVEMERFKISEP
ncbi:MAG TPA: family 16 glycoside hydrolase [Anaerolineales bacterium]|nr:family 16 glycoside hydrolase [Anaerolineales bacterium]